MLFEKRINGFLVCLSDCSSESTSITRRSFHPWWLLWRFSSFFLSGEACNSFFALKMVKKGVCALRVEKETQRRVDVQKDGASELRVLLEDRKKELEGVFRER